MTVEDAVREELEDVDASGALAATALAMAREIDAGNSATSKSMCAKVLMDVLREIRAQAPPKRQEDRVDEIAKRRQERIARAAG